MMKIQNFDGIKKMNYNKVIITVVIVLLLICPNPSYDIRMYTTSILGRITLIIATIAVICYDPVIGIFAILLLLKLTGKPLREGAENMEDDSEKDEEKKPKTKTKKDRFLDKHCVCKAMYDDEGNRNGAAWDNVCKVDKKMGMVDNPKTNYGSAEFWTEVPKKGFNWMGKGKGEKGKQNNNEQYEEASKRPIFPLLNYFFGLKEFGTLNVNLKDRVAIMDEKLKKNAIKNMIIHEGDDPIMNQFHYTDGIICNPCDKESCTNWELGQPSSGGFGGGGGGDKGGDGGGGGDKGGGGGAVEKLIDNW